MTKTSDITEARGESFRVPIDCAVDLRRGAAGVWQRLAATNISMSGMFIRSAEVYPEGTALEVRFELRGGRPAIVGRAEVVWCRAHDGGPDQPRGFGVRFLGLDLESKYAISRLVERYQQLGRMPFLLTPAEDEPGAGTPVALSRRAALALAFLAGAVAGALGSWWWSTAPTAPARQPLRAAIVSQPSARAAPPAAATPPPEAPADDAVAAVGAALDAWVRAWAARDFERYLAAYAPDFRPASRWPRAAWEAQRRERLARPGAIEVVVSALEVEIPAPDRAIARFDQVYATPGYRDRVRKELEWVRRDQGWQILREETLAQLPSS